jgi:glycosyltransferase involved in cell wall biosynthesis
MELRLADEAQFLTQRGQQPLLALSPFPDRNPWLEKLMVDHPTFSRFEFDPPPFFEEWEWRRRNLTLARTLWPQRLRRAKFDLAHIFYAWTFEGGSRLWLCHKAGVPCVLSVHNAFPTEQLLPWHERLTKESFASVRGLYGVSRSALDHFISTYGRYIRDDTVVRVIPNFVDVSRFIPSTAIRLETRSELSIPDNAKVLGSIGRIDIQKQPFQVLQVFDRLWAHRHDIYLVFCGQGPLEPRVRAEVAGKPWADRVRFLGFRKDVERVFPALDVHVLLSKQEGFGISTVEAMACGVPVVATDVPGSRDILTGTDAGELVPYGDLEAAAHVINKLFTSSPDMLSVSGQVSRRFAVEEYSKENWARRLESFYHETM